MTRLSVMRVKGGSLAIDCQADTLTHLATRFTVPLLPLGSLPGRIPVLHPEFEIGGERLVMATHLAGAIPRKAIEETIVTIEDEGYTVQRALDMLTGSGF